MVKLTKQNYVERDISWMLFNHRILEEAQREDVPVLERLSFPTVGLADGVINELCVKAMMRAE